MAEDHYYLTVRQQDDGTWLAVISLGSPQKGDKNVTICSVERCKTQAECEAWYNEEMKTKPWETRQ